MFRPVGESAHVEHENFHRSALMSRDEFAGCLIEVKRSRDRGRAEKNAEHPVKDADACALWRYIHDAKSYPCVLLLLLLVINNTEQPDE